MEYNYIVYWQNSRYNNWKCFSTEEKAIRFIKSLKGNKPPIYSNIALKFNPY